MTAQELLAKAGLEQTEENINLAKERIQYQEQRNKKEKIRQTVKDYFTKEETKYGWRPTPKNSEFKEMLPIPEDREENISKPCLKKGETYFFKVDGKTPLNIYKVDFMTDNMIALIDAKGTRDNILFLKMEDFYNDFELVEEVKNI